jgi:TRAP-type C4-dicarboxylate transport system substrate-binding protein
VIPEGVDIFSIQEKTIENILQSEEEKKAIEAAPKIVDPAQQLVATAIQEYLHHPEMDRNELISLIGFISRPLPRIYGRKILDTVEAGEAGKSLFKTIEEKGVIGLGWGENDYREPTNSKRPVRKPEDLDGPKIRVVDSPIFIDTFRALGANPVSVNWSETLTALQQGTVDGQENPVLSIIIPYKLWEFNKNIPIRHYTIDPLILGVSKETWNSLDPKDLEIVAKAAQEAMAWNKKEARKGLEGSTEAIDMLKSKGMEVVILTAAVKAF